MEKPRSQVYTRNLHTSFLENVPIIYRPEATRVNLNLNKDLIFKRLKEIEKI